MHRFCVSNFWIKFIPFINTIRKKNFFKAFNRDGRAFNFLADTYLK